MPDEIRVCLITLDLALQFTFWGILGRSLFFCKWQRARSARADECQERSVPANFQRNLGTWEYICICWGLKCLVPQRLPGMVGRLGGTEIHLQAPNFLVSFSHTDLPTRVADIIHYAVRQWPIYHPTMLLLPYYAPGWGPGSGPASFPSTCRGWEQSG